MMYSIECSSHTVERDRIDQREISIGSSVTINVNDGKTNSMVVPQISGEGPSKAEFLAKLSGIRLYI